MTDREWLVDQRVLAEFRRCWWGHAEVFMTCGDAFDAVGNLRLARRKSANDN
jgi:hypothetical protein